LTRAIRRRRFRSLEVSEKYAQRAIEDRRQIARGNSVPEQILGATELVVGGICDRALNFVTIW
jgi:hypothetical protein